MADQPSPLLSAPNQRPCRHRAAQEVVGLTLPWQSDGNANLLYRLYDDTIGGIANIMNLCYQRYCCRFNGYHHHQDGYDDGTH